MRSPPAPTLLPARPRPLSKMSGAAVDEHKKSAEEDKNPTRDDEKVQLWSSLPTMLSVIYYQYALIQCDVLSSFQIVLILQWSH